MMRAIRHPNAFSDFLVGFVSATILICAWPAEGFNPGGSNPAVITDRSRDPLIDNDFLRITFAPAEVTVTTPGRPDALRAFFGATRFYQPPLPVEVIADLNGFEANKDRDLVAMRCRPVTTAAAPHLATWPNLAAMILGDFADQHYSCPPTSSEPGNVAYCQARQYTDVPVQPVVTALIAALQFGQQLFQPELGNFLSDKYGIDLNHSGLGFVVRGPAVALNAGEALEQSVVPEYLLRNVNLADANCRCIRVAPYSGRDKDLLQADLIWNRGKLGPGGECEQKVTRLPRGH